MEEILSNIDAYLLETFKSSGLKAYGFCELVTKDGKPNPVTCSLKKGEKREMAQIHDQWNGIFYHRMLPSAPAEEDEEFSFGIKMARRQRIRMRMVIAHKVKLGEDLIFQIIEAFPDRREIDGYKFVFLNQGTLNTDHQGIYIEEYGNDQTTYNKHRTTWNIYAFEYDLEFIKC